MASATGTTDLAQDRVQVYGSQWCPDCRLVVAILDQGSVGYDYIDLGEEEQAHEAAERISGQKHIPVVIFPDGVFYVEPTKVEMVLKIRALQQDGLLVPKPVCGQ